MLHAIDEQGNLSWHCHNPTCPYHNCQGWDAGIQCAAHGEAQRGQPAGQTLTAHISDAQIAWTDAQSISLPPCPACGTQMVVRVHDDGELTPPIITRDEQTGQILQVAAHPSQNYNGNLWFVDADPVRKYIPHPALQHLSPDQISEMQNQIKSAAPDAPVEWMQTTVTTLKINRVVQHPAVARHRALAELLQAAGKVYEQPVEQPAQPMPTPLEPGATDGPTQGYRTFSWPDDDDGSTDPRVPTI